MSAARATWRGELLQTRQAQAADRVLVVLRERTVADCADARKTEGERRTRGAQHPRWTR